MHISFDRSSVFPRILYNRYCDPETLDNAILIMTALGIFLGSARTNENQPSLAPVGLLLVGFVIHFVVKLTEVTPPTKLVEGLQTWKSEAPQNEKEVRDHTVKKIIYCFKRQHVRLNLSRLGITTLPKQIGELSHLQELNLSGNLLHSIPSEIQLLTQLKYLDISHNEFTTIPNEIKALPDNCTLNLEPIYFT